MEIAQPYYRICRPFTDGHYVKSIASTYLLDSRYAPDRNSLIRAYKLLENDLLSLFAYIEPADDNSETYSHELYQLFLRACTEVETNARAILIANGYTESKSFNITVYYKVERACRLSEYVVTLPLWKGTKSSLQPFQNWQNYREDISPQKVPSLTWYQNYNTVKHDRFIKFKLANFENVLNAVAAVFILLFAQFNIFAFSPYYTITSYEEENERIYHEDCLFQIKLPSSWSIGERYDFDWNTLSSQNSPFQPFPF